MRKMSKRRTAAALLLCTGGASSYAPPSAPAGHRSAAGHHRGPPAPGRRPSSTRLSVQSRGRVLRGGRDGGGHSFEDDFDFDDGFDGYDYRHDDGGDRGGPSTSGEEAAPQQGQGATFYSRKSLSDPSFSLSAGFFSDLTSAAGIDRPSRIQSLAWPPLLRRENCVVADQTGSGKTLAYLMPLLQRLHDDDIGVSPSARKRRTEGRPRLLVLTPTAELADQIHSVCCAVASNLGSGGWTFTPFVTTATGSRSTNIRDQIRLLRSTSVDVLISTPGRLSTILRTKNAGLDLSAVTSVVLDEVDFLLVDETFGPQLRAVGVAVNGSGGDGPQFVFVTATLPEDVLASIKEEFGGITEIRGPGLHRVAKAVHQTLVDVSVPASSNRDKAACFDIKVTEMQKALRTRRCAKTLIFCNTVETCRDVENVLRRKDRKGSRSKVWAYHNALSPEVRNSNLRSFSTSSSGGDGAESILVCTDRAARGVDFDSSPVDHVLLFDFPRDPAEYVRRVGRTARAGRAGASTVLAYGWQLPVARRIMGLADGKKGKGKNKGNAKLEGFTMMRSTDGWDDEDEREDMRYMKGGAKGRREMAEGGGRGSPGPGSSGGGKKRRMREKRSRPWER